MADLTLRGQCEGAARLLRSSRPQEAIAVCRRILQAFPRHAATYSLLGQACLGIGRIEEATGLFQQALGADPEQASAYANLAAIYEQQGNADEALWHLQRAVELDPGDRGVRSALCRLYGQYNGHELSRIRMTRGSLVRLYLAGQLYPQAIAELHEIMAAERPRYDLQVSLAEVLWRDGQYLEAQAICERILQDLPHCLKANLILGQLWLNSDQDEQGRALLQRAQALDPDNATAQAIFGSRSPLPLRIARLPLAEEEAPPYGPPDLVEDEEFVEGHAVPEEQAEALPLEHALPVAKADVEEESPGSNGPQVGRGAEGTPEAAKPEGISLIDVRRQYVAEHPDDYQARLDLARRLRDLWKLNQALEHYAILVQQHYEALPEVIRDLESLDRIYPATPALVALLENARARERRSVC